MTHRKEQVERWNRRAGYLLRLLDERPDREKQEPSPLERARATMGRWRVLVDTVPHLALRAAAHQGLEAGPVKAAVESLRRGCLTLAGTTGGGKTVGAAWLAYWSQGSVLWLDAVAVGLAEPAQLAEWRREIPRHGLVVLDDLGAGSSAGDWSSRKVADVLGSILERRGPSIVAMNLDEKAFGVVMDGGVGRLRSRLSMRPNVWVDIAVKDRRPTAVEPPDIDVLPAREAEAHALIQSRVALTAANQAFSLGDVDVAALKRAAKALGFGTWAEVDEAIRESERLHREVEAEVQALAQRLRAPVLAPANEEPGPEPREDPGAAERRRVGLLDLVANVAEARGVDEAEVLASVGRTRRTIRPEDEPVLVAMLTGQDMGPVGDVAL